MEQLRFAIVYGTLIAGEDRRKKDLLKPGYVKAVFRKTVKNVYPASEAVESK